VYILHIGAAIFVNMTVLVGVSALPASHPYRTEMVRNVLPNVWAFLIFLPLFVVLEPSPSTVWYGFSLASAGLINLIVHRKVLIPPSWGPSFPMFAFTAGLGAIAAVGASSHFDSGMFETEMLYGLYGLFSALAVDGSRRRAEVLADGSEADSASS
jgi:hypothetical protein